MPAARGVTGTEVLHLVPNSAVVWYAGLPWIYVRDDDEPEEFIRQALPAESQRPDGWLAPALEDDARVVTDCITHGIEIAPEITRRNFDADGAGIGEQFAQDALQVHGDPSLLVLA